MTPTKCKHDLCNDRVMRGLIQCPDKENMKKTILIDLDSTVVDLCTPWFAKYNEAHNDDLSLDRIKSWDTHLYAKAGKEVFKVLREPGFYRHLPFLPGALENLLILKDQDFHLKIVSYSFPESATDKLLWVQQYLPFIDEKDVFLTHSKHDIKGHFLIDDGPHNIIAYRKHNPRSKIVGISYPYNDTNEVRYAANLLASGYKDTKLAWDTMTEYIIEHK